MASVVAEGPLGPKLDLQEVAQKFKLYEKISRLKEDVVAGRHPVFKVPDHVLRAISQRAGWEQSKEASHHAMANTASTTDANGSLKQSTEASFVPTRAAALINPVANVGNLPVQQLSPPKSSNSITTDAIIAGERAPGAKQKTLHTQPATAGRTSCANQEQGKVFGVLDLDFLDVGQILAAAQAIVPAISAYQPPATHKRARDSDVSLRTESYYSSRASWSPDVAVDEPLNDHGEEEIVDDMDIYPLEDPSAPDSAVQSAFEDEYSPEDHIFPETVYSPPSRSVLSPYPMLLPMDRHRPKIVPDLAYEFEQNENTQPARLEAGSDDDDFYGETPRGPELPGLSQLAFGMTDRPPPRNPLSHRVAIDDSSEEMDDEYEPPAADAFDAFDDGEIYQTARYSDPRRRGGAGGKVNPPTGPKKAKFDKAASRNNGKGKMNQAQQNLRSPANAKTKINPNKRRKVDYAPDPRKRVQQQHGQYRSGADNFSTDDTDVPIKQEPLSPGLRPEMVPLPETPPSAHRRRSGYASDFTGVDDSNGRARGHNKVSHTRRDSNRLQEIKARTVLQQPAKNATPTQPPPRTTASNDVLRITAIGTYSKKPYYNRPIRPGDVIPTPDASVPEYDDTPRTMPPPPIQPTRAATAYAEPPPQVVYRESVHPRPEHIVPTAYAPPEYLPTYRSQSNYPGQVPRVYYDPYPPAPFLPREEIAYSQHPYGRAASVYVGPAPAPHHSALRYGDPADRPLPHYDHRSSHVTTHYQDAAGYSDPVLPSPRDDARPDHRGGSYLPSGSPYSQSPREYGHGYGAPGSASRPAAARPTLRETALRHAHDRQLAEAEPAYAHPYASPAGPARAHSVFHPPPPEREAMLPPPTIPQRAQIPAYPPRHGSLAPPDPPIPRPDPREQYYRHASLAPPAPESDYEPTMPPPVAMGYRPPYERASTVLHGHPDPYAPPPPDYRAGSVAVPPHYPPAAPEPPPVGYGYDRAPAGGMSQGRVYNPIGSYRYQ